MIDFEYQEPRPARTEPWTCLHCGDPIADPARYVYCSPPCQDAELTGTAGGEGAHG